jgi:sulfur carrier protein
VPDPAVPDPAVPDPDVPDPATVRATVNGEPIELAAGTSVAELVARTCPSERGVAVALNREVVPRSSWPVTVVAHGASIEIVTAAAGG